MDPENHPFEKEIHLLKPSVSGVSMLFFGGVPGTLQDQHVAQHAPKLPKTWGHQAHLRGAAELIFIDQPEGLTNGMQMVDSFGGLHSLKN